MPKNPPRTKKSEDWRLEAATDTIRIVVDLLPRFYRTIAGDLVRDSAPSVIPERTLYRLLGVLSHQPGISLTALADRLGMTKTNASPLVEKLVQEGVLLRTPHADDRRIHLLSLTAKGEETFAEGWTRLARGLSDRLADLGDEDGRAFRDALHTVLKTLSPLL